MPAGRTLLLPGALDTRHDAEAKAPEDVERDSPSKSRPPPLLLPPMLKVDAAAPGPPNHINLTCPFAATPVTTHRTAAFDVEESVPNFPSTVAGSLVEPITTKACSEDEQVPWSSSNFEHEVRVDLREISKKLDMVLERSLGKRKLSRRVSGSSKGSGENHGHLQVGGRNGHFPPGVGVEIPPSPRGRLQHGGSQLKLTDILQRGLPKSSSRLGDDLGGDPHSIWRDNSFRQSSDELHPALGKALTKSFTTALEKTGLAFRTSSGSHTNAHNGNNSHNGSQRRGSLTLEVENDTRREAKNRKTEEINAMLNTHTRHRFLESLRDVWHFMEDPEHSTAAGYFDLFMKTFIIITCLFTLVMSVRDPPLSGLSAGIVELTVDCLFLLEFLVRFVACPNHLLFFCKVFNLIDLAAALPLFVRISMGLVLPEGPVEGYRHAFLLCAVPVIRLLKTLRRFEKLQLLLRAFMTALEALPVLIYMLFLLALVFTMLIFLAEGPDNFQYVPQAFWFTIVTMTTVGYGDQTPLKWEGQVATGLLIVATMLYMAVPLGIIGNAFNETWSERDRILLMQRTRDRLRQWGYTAKDIPVLFRLSDDDDDGELSFSDFRTLLHRMQIGFSDERIYQLFSSFDNDDSGAVDDREFVKALFPSEFVSLYERSDDSSNSRAAGDHVEVTDTEQQRDEVLSHCSEAAEERE